MSILKFTYAILLIFVLSKLTFSATALPYSITDLETLEQEKNYEEFLVHARDIRPSKRQKHWKEMVYTMGVGYIEQKTKFKSFNKKEFNFIEKISLWPSLKNDEFFAIKRQSFSLRYFNNCFRLDQNKAECNTQLQSFWYSSRQSPDLAIELQKLLKKYAPDQDTWKFTQIIIKSKISSFYCTKTSAQKRIFIHLSKALKSNSISPKDVINKTMNNACWNKLVPNLKSSLLSRDQSISTLSYKMLKSKKSIAEKTEDLFLTHFVLTRPFNGDIFNKAWTTIYKIGQSYKRRNNLIKSLKSMDPLPGKIFSHPDLKKRKTIIRFLTQNIPEYIDFYAISCVNYLKGIGEFPTGNPTMECPELFKTSKGTKWVKQKVQVMYSGIKKP